MAETVLIGANTIVGVAKEATVNTEIVVTQKLRQKSNSLGSEYQPIPDESFVGTVAQGPPDQGLQVVGGDLSYDKDVRLRDFLLEQFCGTYVDGKAQGTLHVEDQITAGDTMTIDSKVYTFQANGGLTDVDGNIELGLTLGATQTNIVNAINLTGTPGTGYAASMTIHPTVSIAAFATNDAILTAKTGGVAGDSIVTTENFTSLNNVFDDTTLGAVTAGTIITYNLDDEVTGKTCTIAADWKARLYAWTGCHTSQLTLQCDRGGPLMLTHAILPMGEVLGSATNTAVILAALASPQAYARYLFHHLNGQCWIGDLVDALDSDDHINFSGFTLVSNRNQLQDHAQAQTPLEAIANGFQANTLQLRFSRYQSTDTFKDWHNAHTALQAQITFVKGSNLFRLRIPQMYCGPVRPTVTSAGVIGYETTLTLAHDQEDANAWMTFAQAFQIEEV